MRIPTAIMEQNSIPGLTNRILSRLVKRIFTAFDDIRGRFPAGKIVRTGNPIRQQLLSQLAASTRAEERASSTRLFVFGGSQGARAINDAMLEAIPGLLERVPDLEVFHQTGSADFERVRADYRARGLEGRVRVAGFIDDMAGAYGWADLVLCRAGATSVAELAVVGCPAVLVPFPHATDDHQEWNARELVERGAASIERQSQWTSEGLVSTLATLLLDRDKLDAMAEAMRAAARPDAAAKIYENLVELAAARG
jgi:UDP-N-acetylglucosamine--N-acetylmuramyl-(pentapeptide) pyrophosphoryl-undecaprenol N-acetylglucosamine transferase